MQTPFVQEAKERAECLWQSAWQRGQETPVSKRNLPNSSMVGCGRMKFYLYSLEKAENPARRGRKSHVPRPQKDVGSGVLEIRGRQALAGRGRGNWENGGGSCV